LSLKSVEFLNALKATVDALGLNLSATLLGLNFSASAVDEMVAALEKGDFVPVRLVLEQAYASDAAQLAVGRPIADALAVIDQLERQFSKGASDSALAQEALQTAFGKASSNIAIPTDVLTANFGKSPLDTPVATDEDYNFAVQKALFSALSVTDDVDGEASILDDQEIQFVKTRTDAASVAETLLIVASFLRTFSDASSTSDAVTLGTQKSVVDNLALTDTVTLLYTVNRFFTEAAAVTESSSKTFSRPRADSAFLGDAATTSPNKGLFETTSFTDAGSLRSQGYADFTYFQEDYVGASRTFS
jgi:hypothetical protein